MNCFFFDLDECGEISAAEEGVELPDLVSARTYAIGAARDIMSAEVKDGRLCLRCRINVRTGDGSHLLTVRFSEALEIAGL